jgi:hypothetical protein
VGVEIGTPIDQQLQCRRVSLIGGPHERRRAAQVFLGIDVRAVIEQGANRGDVARPRRHHQRRLAARHLLVRVRPGLEEPVDDLRLAVQGGQHQRREAFLVRHLGIRARLQEQVGQRDVGAIHRPVQRRRAVGLWQVHIRFLSDERPHGRDIASHGRVRHIALGGTDGRNTQQQRNCGADDEAIQTHRCLLKRSTAATVDLAADRVRRRRSR